MNNFPKIKRDTVATYKGNFYLLRNEHWYKMELYLPCGTGTYQEPLETTANRFLDDIESGKRPFKFAIKSGGSYNSTDYKKFIKTCFETSTDLH